MPFSLHPARRRTPASVLALALGTIAAAAGAATFQNFESAGTPYTPGTHAGAPGPAVVEVSPTDHFLRLASSPSPINNTVAFDRSDSGAFCRVVAEFDFRITGAADGMGFALLNTAAYGTTGAVPPEPVGEEPNFLDSLGIGFDIYQNPEPGDIDDNHVSIHYDGEVLDQFTAGAIDLNSGDFIHARIELVAAPGQATVTVILTPPGGEPVEVVPAFVIPGLEPYESRVHFGARSGGLAADHDVDDLSVTFSGCASNLCPDGPGAWSSVFSLPVVAIHAHLLPTGQVMFWDRHDDPPGGENIPHFWDPNDGDTGELPVPGDDYDVFCSGHSFLPDGRLLVTGGHIADGVGLPNASTYDPFTQTWTRYPDMNAGRWYPTNLNLPNGDVLVLSGEVVPGTINPLPQVFETATGTWRDLTDAELVLPLYPFMYLAPDGRAFTAGPQKKTRCLDTSGTGEWTVVGDSGYGLRDYGSSVLYDEGKILIVGGSPGGSYTIPATASAEVIDLRHFFPAWRPVAPMAYPRRQLNATLLPDGTVLVTGGSSGARFTDLPSAVLPAELWNPGTETWCTLAAMQVPRLYHSTALLLPDGRVLSAGGGHPSDEENLEPDHFDAEIFSPPYLSKGPQPTITSAPATVPYGATFFVATPDAASITGVTLIRLPSVTHGFNQNQGFNRLAFLPIPGGVQVQAPSDPVLCPAGHYMLFLLNADGVPSVAKIVRIGADELTYADLGFYTVPPCRLLDTRRPNGPLGGPVLQGSSSRTFVLTGNCGVPATARALSVNLTVTQPAAAGHLTLFPADQPMPVASSINFGAGQTRANNAILVLAGDGTGAVRVFNAAPGTVHFLLDVNGYFE